MTIFEEREAEERRKLIRALQCTQGKVKHAAIALGMSWRTVYKWIEKWNLNLEDYRETEEK